MHLLNTIPKKLMKRVTPLRLALLSLLLVFLLAIGYFTSLHFVAVLVSLFLSYKILNLFLHSRIFDSLVFKSIVTVVLYICFLECVSLLVWVINHEFSLQASTLVALLLLLIIFLFYTLIPFARAQVNQPITRQTWTTSDVLAIILTIVFVGTVIIAPAINVGGWNKGSLFMIINDGVDDAAHLGLLNDRLQFDRGVLHKTSIELNTRSEGSSFYPAGWHSANAAIMLAIKPDIQTGVQSLYFYAISKLFWYTVLILLFIRSVFSFYSLLSSRKLSLPIIVWISTATLIFSYLFLLHPFRAGYYSFIPQLISVIVFVLFLAQLSLSRHNEKLFQKTLPLTVLVAIGGTLSWLLVLPVFVFAALLSLFDRIKNTTYKAFGVELIRGLVTHIFLYTVVIGAALTQLYVTSHSRESVSFIEGILLSGGIATYTQLFYTFILIGVAFAVVYSKREALPILRPIVYYLTISLLFAALLFGIQLYLVQESLYYYYKTLNTFTIIAIMLSIAGFAYLIDSIKDSKGIQIALMTAILLPASIMLIIPQDNSNAGYIEGHRFVSPVVNQKIAAELTSNSTESSYDKKDYTLYYLSGDERQNDIGSMLVKSNKPESGCLMRLKLLIKATPVEMFDATKAKEHQHTCVAEATTVHLVVNPVQYADVQAKVIQQGLQDFLAVESLN